MWGSDYPHPDGVWPESSKYIEEQFEGLPAEVVHRSPAKRPQFYGLITDPSFQSVGRFGRGGVFGLEVWRRRGGLLASETMRPAKPA